jgi:hypothetical protein
LKHVPGIISRRTQHTPCLLAAAVFNLHYEKSSILLRMAADPVIRSCHQILPLCAAMLLFV